MLPQEWDECHAQIRRTYQYIQMKVKLYFTYEERDNAIKATFEELMTLPNLPEEFFPKHYFDVLLKFLTRDQKQRYFKEKVKESQKRQETDMKIQLQIIKHQLKLEEDNPNGCYSLEIDDLRKIDIIKYEENLKKNAANNRTSQALQAKKESTKDLQKISQGVKGKIMQPKQEKNEKKEGFFSKLFSKEKKDATTPRGSNANPVVKAPPMSAKNAEGGQRQNTLVDQISRSSMSLSN